MLFFVSFERRWRRMERRRYWVLERSVWRIESLRFRVGLLLLLVVVVGSEEEAARSSIVSIYIVFEGSWVRVVCRIGGLLVVYLVADSLHHSVHQGLRPWEELRHAALGDPEAREQLVVQCGGFGSRDIVAINGGKDVIDIHGGGCNLSSAA